MVRSVRSFAAGLCFVLVFLLALMLAQPAVAFADPQEGNIFSETNDDYDIGDGTNWTGKLSDVKLSLTGNIGWTDDFNILDWETWGFQLSLTFEEKGNFDIEIMKGQQDYYRTQFHDKGTEFPLSLNVYDKKNAVAGATRPAKMSGTFDDSYTFELIWKAFHFPSNITWNTVHDDKSVKYEFTSIEPTEENLPDGTDFHVYFGIENDIGVAGPALSDVVKPILDGDISFDGGIHAHPVLHRNEFDSSAEYLNDTVEAIHSCTDLGKEGCLSGTADKIMVDNITLYCQLIADFYPYPTFIDRTEIIGTDNLPTIKNLGHFVQSLTWKDPLEFKDACDHICYKVPVAVWKNQEMTNPAPGVYVQALDVHTDPNVVKYTMGKTGSNPTITNTGGINLYLPFIEGRYTVFVNPSKSDPQYHGLGGEAEQPSDMRRGVNERVDIILEEEEKLTYYVEKSWFIDLEQNDKPDSIDVLLQSKQAGEESEWQDVETKTLNRDNSWECYFSAPKYSYDDEGQKLITYRVRELKEEDGNSGDSPGSRVVEESVEYTVPAYTTLAGEEVGEHKTKYLVEYKEEKEGDDQILVTIKNSAVLEFTLEKLWENFDDKDKPDSVFLALCYRVNSKYLDKLPPNPYKRVAEVWIPVFSPISGDMIDILSLLDLDWIEKVDPTGITKKLKVPLAMGIANEDNDWKLKYTTYKYGWTIVPEIPVDFKAMELTSAIVTDVVELLTGFDIPISAAINPGEGSLYISVPIKPMPIPGLNRDWDRYAIIINIYTGGENAIAGVKYWCDDTEDDRPDKLYIHVKDPDTKEEICDPVELNKEDFAGQDYWIWTLTESQTTTGELDPDKTYLISESFPEGYSSSYACEVDGHNLINTKGKKLKLVITKEFQPEDPAKYPDRVEIQIKNNRGEIIGKDYYPLDPHIATDRKIELIDGEDGVSLNQEDLNALTITEQISSTSISDEWLPEITGPVRSTDDEYVIYTYKIINHLQTDVALDLNKEWAGYAGHPGQVELTLERSTAASPVPEVIGTVTLSGDNGWHADVSQDSEGNPLKRYDQSGLEYTYTAEEDVPEGYRCTVTETKEEKEITYEVIWHIKVKNTLYEPVIVKGTKTWTDGDGSTRPASIRVRLMTETGPALDEHGNVIEEEVTGNPSESEWPFAFSKKVPKNDGDGNLIQYSVVEYSGVDPASGALKPVEGYTAYYADPVLDSNVWTCDITNVRICTITYDPNGGTIRGSTKPLKEQHMYGDVITIIGAPVRDEYQFLYWKGSRYNPGDSYTVKGDHTFVAQWERDDPLYYPFTFTKIWVGRTEDTLSWTLYNEDGTVRHKSFNKTVVSDTEWQYSAWFPSMQDYYLIENVPNKYRVRYVNVGIHAGETDRLYNGGTVINYWIPRTGDRSGLLWWLGAVLLGCALLGGLCLAGKKKRAKK